jgi:hypothetical protein
LIGTLCQSIVLLGTSYTEVSYDRFF